MNLDILVIGITVLLCVGCIVWLVLQWADKKLERQKETLAHQASTTLADMFIFLDPQKMFRYNVTAMIVLPAVVWFLTANPLFTVVALIATFVLPKYYVNHLRVTRLKTLEKQLPDALLMITGAMSAGASLNVAIESMIKEQRPPIAQEFELMVREQRMGVDFDAALRNMEKRNPVPDFALVISALRISREVGGNLAEILDNVADTLRERAMIRRQIKVLTAEGRLSAWVLAALPVAIALYMFIVNPAYIGLLFTHPIGLVMLGGAILLLIAGILWMRKIVDIDV